VCGNLNLGWAQPEFGGCEWTQFKHANGAVASEGCLVNGIPTGIWTSYSDRGVKLSEGERKNDEPHGIWRFYENGALAETCEFQEGFRQGIQTLWNEGVLSDSILWVGGKRDGVAKSFRPDGTLAQEMSYEKDKREGKAVQYNIHDEPHGYRW